MSVTQSTSNTVIFQSTFSKEWFKKDMDDLLDSGQYYHFLDFQFPSGMPQGEWRYYVYPYIDGEVKVENNKIYIDGVETAPEASGLLQYGEYTNPVSENEYNKQDEFIQYEG